MPTPVFELKCKLQEYDWGQTGLNGLAAQMAHASGTHEFQLDEKKQYAELWMGTHQNGPASLQDGTPLQKHVDTDKEYFLGKSMLKHFDGDSTVPFLFKILTARKALQLQIHPDKKSAAKLHEQSPDEFKDTNHKPEIALAVTKFEVFAGFRPPAEINNLLTSVPELSEILETKEVPESASKEEQTAVVKKMLSVCFDMKDSTPAYEKLMKSSGLSKFSQEKDLLRRAQEMYPGDAGALVVVFLMNYFVLQPGDASYVKENGIHAWFYGEGMIECMATSDNVINAGFLPEGDRAKKQFLDLVRYDSNPRDDHHVHSEKYEKGSGKTIVYDPPIEEFSILKTDLSKGEKEEIDGVEGPGILICVEGEAKVGYEKGAEKGDFELSKGHVFFVAAGTKLSYEAKNTLQVYEGKFGISIHDKTSKANSIQQSAGR
jgi:mannose-6-phosphate isomerase